MLVPKKMQADALSLNESPSEKAGKFPGLRTSLTLLIGLNESPSKKEGKFRSPHHLRSSHRPASMKVPPKRKGNAPARYLLTQHVKPSMKVPPKRKGNPRPNNNTCHPRPIPQ